MKKLNPTKKPTLKPTLKKELLGILCCPNCRGDLNYSTGKSTLTCKRCKSVYPVRDGIPMMLADRQQ